MPIPQSILDRIEVFSRNRDSYLSSDYKETELRREFLDPLFEALGWDIFNRAGYAEDYKDVVHEDTLRVPGVGLSAPDYSFRIGGTRKFFVEAKKPAIRIKDDPEPALQLRRYSWSAKLPLGIVTDFQEFAVYDTRIKIREGDKASVARIFYCTFDELPEKWDWLASIFSREAVLRGAFDKYAATSKGKRGTAEFDDAFLEDMERWRKLLAENLALRNATLTQRDLNFAVQRILDRIIFLRIAEDRGIESYGQLSGLTAGPKIYPRLCEIFERADYRYNSGLFHFVSDKSRDEAPDKLTLGLHLDDAVLKELITSLYYPKSPYAFAVIPADILGHVYEQFLGKVIHLTEGHRAKIEEKPEVRKAGGVYYTPTYIVNYIVRQTVGPLVDGKTPKQVEKLRVLDPACGSGSFLLGAYEFLLDWHLDWYRKNEPDTWAKKKTPPIYETSPNAQGIGQGSKNWRLTTAERKRILVNNLYGVDIDAQAVEVTKLSLLLKVLEGEARELQGKQLDFHRVLPDLGQNIKCGNSLIGSDFYSQPNLPAFDEDARYKLNVFDWNIEFKPIMDTGGFDGVIGNPPWGALFSAAELEYLRQRHQSIIVRMIDSFMYFIDVGQNLLRKNGAFGMILPDVVLYQSDSEKLRQFLLEGMRLTHICNLGDVFEQVIRPACIIAGLKGPSPAGVVLVVDLRSENKSDKPSLLFSEGIHTSVQQISFTQFPRRLFATSKFKDYCVWTRVKAAKVRRLDEIVDEDGIQRGVSPDLKEAFLVDHGTAAKWKLEKEKLRPVLTGGRHVKRYYINRPDLLLIYTGRNDDYRKLPNICAFIEQFKERITCKEVLQKKHSLYALHRAREPHIFHKPQKLLGVITEDEVIVALDADQTYATDGLYLFGLKPEIDIRYIMALLNSRLFVMVYRLLSFEEGRALAQVKPTILADLPIRNLDRNAKQDRVQHDTLVAHVDRMLKLHEDLAAAKSPDAQSRLQREIAATDRAIDQLVYQLYNLTPEEIALVEAATAPAAKPAETDSNEALPVLKSTVQPPPAAYIQAEADAAHTYFVKEDTPPKAE